MRVQINGHLGSTAIITFIIVSFGLFFVPEFPSSHTRKLQGAQGRAQHIPVTQEGRTPNKFALRGGLSI